jgi:hypothetical protein
MVDLSRLAGRAVVYIYPRTGVLNHRCRTTGTPFPVRADAHRNPAPSAIILPS